MSPTINPPFGKPPTQVPSHGEVPFADEEIGEAPGENAVILVCETQYDMDKNEIPGTRVWLVKTATIPAREMYRGSFEGAVAFIRSRGLTLRLR